MSNKPKTTDKDLGYKHIRKEVKNLKDSFVTIGIHEKAGNYPNGTPVSLVAAVNEFGTTKAGRSGSVRIPERSFMRSTFDENKSKWQKLNNDLLADVLLRGSTVDKTLNQMGLVIMESIKAKILKMRDPPNAPSTRRKKGFDNPLVDSRLLWRSINYEVKI